MKAISSHNLNTTMQELCPSRLHAYSLKTTHVTHFYQSVISSSLAVIWMDRLQLGFMCSSSKTSAPHLAPPWRLYSFKTHQYLFLPSYVGTLWPGISMSGFFQEPVVQGLVFSTAELSETSRGRNCLINGCASKHFPTGKYDTSTFSGLQWSHIAIWLEVCARVCVWVCVREQWTPLPM